MIDSPDVYNFTRDLVDRKCIRHIHLYFFFRISANRFAGSVHRLYPRPHEPARMRFLALEVHLHGARRFYALAISG